MAQTDAERKRLILQQVNATPGVNLRQVQRYTKIPLSTTARLLDELEAERKVVSESTAAFRWFFPSGKRVAGAERSLLVMANKPRPRRIIEAILDNPGMRHGDLADSLNLPAPTLTYYMKQVVSAGLVKVQKSGVERRYRLKNPALARKVLDRTRAGFQEKLA
jgi:predicted transcriptional regulator